MGGRWQVPPQGCEVQRLRGWVCPTVVSSDHLCSINYTSINETYWRRCKALNPVSGRSRADCVEVCTIQHLLQWCLQSFQDSNNLPSCGIRVRRRNDIRQNEIRLPHKLLIRGDKPIETASARCFVDSLHRIGTEFLDHLFNKHTFYHLHLPGFDNRWRPTA